RRRDGAVRRGSATRAVLDKLWAELISEDGRVANRALWGLAAAPEQSLPFVRDRLRPLLGTDADRVSRLIAQLDDDDFDVRERATTDLAAMGQSVEPVLK